MKSPLLLEISAWPWLERLSRAERRMVTLADVPAAQWDAILRPGFDLVYLMGVWGRSAIGRDLARTDPSLVAAYDHVLPDWTLDDVPGSPYCIQAYVPAERMGGWAGLQAAREALRSRGAGLVLDFVPNHTGFDHAWVAEHPTRYVLGKEEDARGAPGEFRRVDSVLGPVFVACARDPYFPPWRDVAQLNFFNPDTRLAVRGVLRELSARCDGVRCDMAMLVLNDVFERTWRHLLDDWGRPVDEFWPVATRENPGLTCVAEVYWDLEDALIDQGFEYAYDKRVLDSLHAADAAWKLRALLSADRPSGIHLARFLENHDEPRSASMLGPRLPAAASLVSTLPGMRFFFDGQLEGRRIKAPVQLARWPDEPVDHAIRELYERVLPYASNRLLHEGEWHLLALTSAGDNTFNDLVAYFWRTRESLAVIVVNPGSSPAQAYAAIAGELGRGDLFDFEDRLNSLTYRWTRDALERTGLYVRLDGGSAHLFMVRPSDGSPQS
jgi:glycosidase